MYFKKSALSQEENALKAAKKQQGLCAAAPVKMVNRGSRARYRSAKIFNFFYLQIILAAKRNFFRDASTYNRLDAHSQLKGILRGVFSPLRQILPPCLKLNGLDFARS